MTAVGVPSDGSIEKSIVNKQIVKTKTILLEMEDVYYNFRDDFENILQNLKYRLDKLTQMVGDMENVSE